MSVELTKRLFTVDDYHRMADAGILGPDDRVELIEGEVLAMSPIGPAHGAAIDRATRTFVLAVGDRAIARIQGSVRLDQYNEPQPDIVLLRPRDDYYAKRLPSPADILLIVEVADSSLEYDRNIKARLYAVQGIHEYWVADLTQECLFAHSDPETDTYRAIRQLRRGETIAPLLLPDCAIDVDALLA